MVNTSRCIYEGEGLASILASAYDQCLADMATYLALIPIIFCAIIIAVLGLGMVSVRKSDIEDGDVDVSGKDGSDPDTDIPNGDSPENNSNPVDEQTLGSNHGPDECAPACKQQVEQHAENLCKAEEIENS